jgi:hypothetical protein
MRNEIVVGLDDSPSGKAALDWGGSAGQEHRCSAASHARARLAIRAQLRGLPKPY